MIFQTASPSQAQELANLVNSAYRGEHSLQGWTTEASLLDGQRTDAESLTELIETPLTQIDFAIDEEKIIASVLLVQEPPDTLYFGMLTVEPALQGKGLGKILIDHIEKVAKSYGFARVRFTVIPLRTELIAFYERRGFVETGKFEPFPSDPRFGLPKVDGLILKEFEKVLASCGSTLHG